MWQWWRRSTRHKPQRPSLFGVLGWRFVSFTVHLRKICDVCVLFVQSCVVIKGIKRKDMRGSDLIQRTKSWELLWSWCKWEVNIDTFQSASSSKKCLGKGGLYICESILIHLTQIISCGSGCNYMYIAMFPHISTYPPESSTKCPPIRQFSGSFFDPIKDTWYIPNRCMPQGLNFSQFGWMNSGVGLQCQ